MAAKEENEMFLGLMIVDFIFSIGVGLVTHSFGWALISFVAFPFMFVKLFF